MSKKFPFPQRRLLVTLLLSTSVSIGLLLARVISTQTYDYWFLAWNLFLCWVPLAFSWWLVQRLGSTRWLSIPNIIITLLWLGFLPNAFYIVSDLIHIKSTGDISILFDVVMMVSFIWNGFILGYMSLYMVHQQLRKRLSKTVADSMIGVVLLLCSFAIYLGRYLRWNSWDVLVNPAGLIFDVSEPFVNPGSHPQAFTTTLMFFILLASIYAVGFELITILRTPATKQRS
jgi:uncharacterized membrane protein